jgi:bacterioferritin-associated ferredoxin
VVVCHCLVVNDRTISELCGDDGATVDDVMAASGAGTRCGGCRSTIARLVESPDEPPCPRRARSSLRRSAAGGPVADR